MSINSIKNKAKILRNENDEAKNSKERVAAIFNDVADTINEINKNNALSLKGEALPTTIPTPWNVGQPDLYEKYDVFTPGIFAHFKDASNNSITVTSSDLEGNIVYLIVSNNIAKKEVIDIPFNLSNYAKENDVKSLIGIESQINIADLSKIQSGYYYSYGDGNKYPLA